MEDSEIKKELRQLLVEMSNLIEKDEKNYEKDEDRMKLENDNLKRELWQMNEKIQQLSDDLQQKELIIGQKDEVIAQHEEEFRKKDVQFDEKLKKNNDVIRKQAELLHLKDSLIVQKKMELAKQKVHLNEKEVVIAEQNSYIDDLNEIIDKRELEIISKEDIIDEKIAIIKSQELKVFDLNNMIASMNQHIQNLKEAKKQSTHCSNAKGSIMYDRLKMHHRNSIARCQQYADKIVMLEEYISYLHATLEHNQIFDDTCDVTDASSGADVTMDSHEMFGSDNNENKDPNLLPVSDVKIDVTLDRVKSDLLDMMDETDDCMLQMSNVVDSKIEKSSNLMKIKHKNSLGKKSSAKKIQKPRKKVKFSNIMTVALY